MAQKKEEAQAKAVTPGGIMALNLIVLDKEETAPTNTPGGEGKTKGQPTQDDTPAAKTPKDSKSLAS